MLVGISAWWLRPRRTFAVRLLRIGLGALALQFFAQHISDRALLWGINGEIDWPFYSDLHHDDPFALYGWSSASWFPDAIYAVSVLICLWFISGHLPQLSALALFVVLKSAFERNWSAIDGGHNIMSLLVLYLACSPNPADGRALRLTHLFERRFRITVFSRFLDPVMHNVAVVLILGQICMLYFWSGFYKVAGAVWRDGSAVYYVMRTAEFDMPGVSRLIYEHGALVNALTYSTLLFQLVFPVAMWLRNVKPLLFAVAVSFHIGIAVTMGLALFSFTMIVADLALFDDQFFSQAAYRIREVGERVRLALHLRAIKS